MLLDNKLNFINANIEEEFVDAVSMHMMYIMIYHDLL